MSVAATRRTAESQRFFWGSSNYWKPATGLQTQEDFPPIGQNGSPGKAFRLDVRATLALGY